MTHTATGKAVYLPTRSAVGRAHRKPSVWNTQFIWNDFAGPSLPTQLHAHWSQLLVDS